MTNHSAGQELLFYVGSYGAKDQSGIYLCKLDLATGRLELVSGTSGVLNPSYIAIDAAASRLYAVGEHEQGSLASFQIDGITGNLSLIHEQVMEGADPCHLSLSSSGHVFVAHYSSGHVNSFAIADTGNATTMVSEVQHTGGSNGYPGRQEAAHAHSIVVNAAGTHAYVSDLGQDGIVIYQLKDGIMALQASVALPPGTGPRHLVLAEQHSRAYGINELNNTITIYNYDGSDGSLEVADHISTLPQDFDGENYPAHIDISADGAFLYASNRGHDSIVRYEIDPTDGGLSSPSWTSVEGRWPRNFAVLEHYVLVANQFSDSIVALRRDSETGLLHSTGYQLEIKAPSCVVAWTDLSALLSCRKCN